MSQPVALSRVSSTGAPCSEDGRLWSEGAMAAAYSGVPGSLATVSGEPARPRLPATSVKVARRSTSPPTGPRIAPNSGIVETRQESVDVLFLA